MSNAAPYRLFDAAMKRRHALSPSLSRITFTGSDVAAMRSVAPDQRIKIFFPSDDGQPPALPLGGDWYQAYRSVPPPERGPMRTYTIRALRPAVSEMDVDFVLHGATGPASRWAIGATPGSAVQIAAPHAAFEGDPGGYEWKPPSALRHALLVADETALPAAAGILEALAERTARPMVEAFLEVPTDGDRLELPHWPGLRVTWLTREGAQPACREGAMMAQAVRSARLPASAVGEASGDLVEIDIDHDIVWERAVPQHGSFYAWVAGESEAVMTIRRFLVKEKGLDRRSMNLMGYWRRGRALDDAA